MSHSFYVEGPPPKTSLLQFEGVVCREEEHLAEHDVMEEDFFYHFHRPLVSTRGVEVGYNDGAFSVRFLALSSIEDYDLGFTILERVSPTMDGLVRAEDGDRIPITVLRKNYDRAWIDSMLEMHATALLSGRIGGPNETISFEGAVRSVKVGPRFRAELAKGPAETAIERLLDRVREIQYVDADDACYAANVMEVSPPGREPFTTTAWAPGLPYFFPKVDYLSILRGQQQGMVQVPYAAALELAGSRARYLDEEQLFVEAIDGDDWAALIAHAEKIAVDPANESKPTKRWWQFWK